MHTARLARPSPVASLVSLAALVALAASCRRAPDDAPAPPLAAAPWPKFRGDSAQDGRGRARAIASAAAPWTFATGKGIFSSPVIGADGTTYVGSADRTFYAIGRDGALRWSVQTGEIIDSAALLDDRGRVYFGSGDGLLRALDAATGAVVWTMRADDPSVNGAFIRWFEGNVAIGPSGDLYAPNDNFSVYAIDRDTGAVRWRFRMPDQTWSSPAIDVRDGTLFLGNNNLLPILGKNTFAIAPSGQPVWNAVSLGSVAASPMLAGDAVVVGGFDGYVRAYDRASGDVRWSFAARDHVYASPARLRDGTVVQPSADGTVYALDPATGAARWTFDTREPIRSSPAVDADDNVYFGGGDGRLYALRSDGTLRWSMRLVDGDRNDLNSSPALGDDGIVLGAESGQLFFVPYDWCLRDDGRKDARCSVAPPASADGASLLVTTRFGSILLDPPAAVHDDDPIALSLVVREAGAQRLAILDASAIEVTTDPPTDVDVRVAGDAKFVTITPKGRFAAGADGAFTLHARARYLVNMERAGLRLRGGVPGGEAAVDLRFAIADSPAPPDAGSSWDLTRLALPLPTLLPSYNQIGFDSLHYLVSMVEDDGARGVAWMIGAALPAGADGDRGGAPVPDPTTKALCPLAVTRDGGRVTFANEDGMMIEAINVTLPFRTFRATAHLDAAGEAREGVTLSGSTICGGIELYGSFLQQLGMCNPQTDALVFFGGADLRRRAPDAAPAGVGTVTFAREKDAVVATIDHGALRAAEHVASVLLVDAATGAPVTLGYALETTRTTDASGALTGVRVPFGGRPVPAQTRAYLMIDTVAAAHALLAAP